MKGWATRRTLRWRSTAFGRSKSSLRYDTRRSCGRPPETEPM